MKVFVKIKVGCKKEKVEKVDENHFIVSVKERPIKGLANKALIKALANYFKIGVSNINIISGFKSRQKIIKVNRLTC